MNIRDNLRIAQKDFDNAEQKFTEAAGMFARLCCFESINGALSFEKYQHWFKDCEIASLHKSLNEALDELVATNPLRRTAE